MEPKRILITITIIIIIIIIIIILTAIIMITKKFISFIQGLTDYPQ